MEVKLRETYGFLRFGVRDPARGEPHCHLVPWSDAFVIKLPHWGLTGVQAKIQHR